MTQTTHIKPTMQRRVTVLSAALIAFVLSGCALSEFDADSVARVQPVEVSLLQAPARSEPEARVPRQLARSFGEFYAAPAVERTLSSVLQRLVPFSGRAELRYSVTVLDSATINAFALPDGQLFVTRGLLAIVNDPSEIAAVLSHEMAHVTARHAAQRVEQAQSAVLAQRVVANLATDRRAADRALAMSAMSLASFSRSQELEADVMGMRTSARAGFDPFGTVRFLQTMDRMQALQGGPFVRTGDAADTFLATHPSTPERLQAAMTEARRLSSEAPSTGADRDSLLSAIDGLAFGDDPRRGVVRGRTYLHPTLGFRFVAPPEFGLENTARAVLGASPDGRALRFDAVSVPQNLPLTEALTASATPEFIVEAVEPRIIAGFAGAVARGRSPGWAFRIVLIRKDAAVYRFLFAARELDGGNDRLFLEAAESFARLPAEEAREVRSQRIRLIEAGPGDTLDTLAARMAVEDRKPERFAALNGLAPSAAVEPGRRYKIVTD
jgi:predicted Zn-dependent protease